MIQLARTHRGKRSIRAAAASLSLLAAACGGAATSVKPGPVPVSGGVATVADLVGFGPYSTFPFTSAEYASTSNVQDFQYLMYRPLYYFGGESTSPAVNYPLSPARPPVYTDGGRTVVITLKGWKWSDGETVDARDVVFWLHMMVAESPAWPYTMPGGIPQNIASMTVTSPDQLTLQLTRPFASDWYTDNELSQITPMPMAWDISRAGGMPGSGGCTADTAADRTRADPRGYAKCVTVFNYLSGQARSYRTYTAPGSIWATVDGPWRLSAFKAGGSYTFVPNPKYSGRPKPHLAAVQFVPYLTPAGVFAALAKGALDIGTVPPRDLPAKPAGPALPRTSPLPAAYTLQPAYGFDVNYYLLDFTNPEYGPLFRQLYIRQALQDTVDQNSMITAALGGYGYPTTGPIPAEPASPWRPAAQHGEGPYPYSIAAARALLASHGWTEVGGVDTCTDPGSAAAQCGAGIRKGLRLKFTLYDSQSIQGAVQEAAIYRADAARAGLALDAVVPYTGLLGPDWYTPCPVRSGCDWEMAMIGGWGYWPDYEPTGEDLFATDGYFNNGGYSDLEMDRLIAATETNGGAAAFRDFNNYATAQLPVIWLPVSYGVVAVRSSLHGVVQNSVGALVPEYWYYAKKARP